MRTNSWISGLCALLILIGISSSSLAAPTPQAESLFQQGNDLYGQGKYREALQIYTGIATREGVSAALLYNIGNSYAQTGQTGDGKIYVIDMEQIIRIRTGQDDDGSI